jgi:hypothetical protein
MEIIGIRDKHSRSATLHGGHLLLSRAYCFDTSVENLISSVPTGQRGTTYTKVEEVSD